MCATRCQRSFGTEGNAKGRTLAQSAGDHRRWGPRLGVVFGIETSASLRPRFSGVVDVVVEVTRSFN